MPLKSKRVNLSINPNKVKSILHTGRENRLQNRDGALRLTTICTEIVYFISGLQSEDEIAAQLREEGGTLFDLIRRAVKSYISNN